ncbi:MAG: SOS response-associated peptidase [Janthinobacterium lividum]
MTSVALCRRNSRRASAIWGRSFRFPLSTSQSPAPATSYRRSGSGLKPRGPREAQTERRIGHPASPTGRSKCSTCGRYKRKTDKQDIAEIFHVNGSISDLPLPPEEDIRPTMLQPIIRENRETGERDLVAARWGFIPSWQKPEDRFPPTTFNARAEGIEKAGMWKRAFASHRCLVPADSFYEWKKLCPKNNPKYEIALEAGKPFAFAGLWGAWKNPDTGDWLQSYTIITTDPNELMESIHTRMPVILDPKDYDRWLSREMTDQPPLDLLRPYEAAHMTARLTENKQEEIFVEPNSA